MEDGGFGEEYLCHRGNQTELRKRRFLVYALELLS
jgi:hypothetical protein